MSNEEGGEVGADVYFNLKCIFSHSFFIEFPGRDLGGYFSFIEGFRMEAWYACIAFVFSVPAVFVLIYKLLDYFEQKQNHEWNYLQTIFLIFGAVSQQVHTTFTMYVVIDCEQGTENTPKYTSTRIVFLIIFLGSVLLFQNFSASYTSFLSVVTEYKPFDGMQSLYEDTEFDVGTPEGWVTVEMFKVR